MLAEGTYKNMIESGVHPQIARSILPTCLATRVVMTANLREWMHVFRLRCTMEAHPDMRHIMMIALEKFAEKCPVLFAPMFRMFTEGSK